MTNRATRRTQAKAAEASHPLSLTTREATIVLEGLLLVDLFLGRPNAAPRPYGPAAVEQLRRKLVAAVPEIEAYAREAEAPA